MAAESAQAWQVITRTNGAKLHILDSRILLDRTLPEEPLPTDPNAPVYLDIQSVRNPATRARNVRYRVAVAPGWTCRFGMTWDRTMVSTAEMDASQSYRSAAIFLRSASRSDSTGGMVCNA
jgi:hypothetical protein